MSFLGLPYRIGEWDIDFQKYLNELKKKKNVVWVGDLNVAHEEIDLWEPKGRQKCSGFTPQERKSFGDFLKTGGWVDTFRAQYPEEKKWSWWSMRSRGRPQNKGWRLDYGVVNSEFHKNVTDARIMDQVHGSDHCPVELTITL